MTIKKAKLNNKGGVDVTYIDPSGNERVLKGTHQIDEPLARAFVALNPFLADITEQKESGFIDWGETDFSWLPVKVKGVSRQVGDAEKVILHGVRNLAREQTITLDTPPLLMETLHYEYPHAAQLDKWLGVLYQRLEYYIEQAEGENVKVAIEEVLGDEAH